MGRPLQRRQLLLVLFVLPEINHFGHHLVRQIFIQGPKQQRGGGVDIEQTASPLGRQQWCQARMLVAAKEQFWGHPLDQKKLFNKLDRPILTGIGLFQAQIVGRFGSKLLFPVPILSINPVNE